MRRLTDDMVVILDEMANGNPKYKVHTEKFLQDSFDFIGDLRRGGRFPSYIRIAIPFWQWYAHIIKFTLYTMPFKYPGRTLFLNDLASLASLYRETYGVNLPYAADFIPFGVSTFEEDGELQEYVTGIGTNAWYPAGTFSPIASPTGEEVNFVSFGTGATTPIFISLLEIFASVGARKAMKFDDRDILVAARDEYGMEIEDIISTGFLKFAANRLFQAIPLAPSLMSQAGRSDNSLPLPGMVKQRYTRGGGSVPEELRETTRGDITSIVQQLGSGEFDKAGKSWLMFMSRFVSLSFSRLPGAGPKRRERVAKDYKFKLEDERRKERNILKALIEIHNQETREFREVESPDFSNQGRIP